jgi:hemolysin III
MSEHSDVKWKPFSALLFVVTIVFSVSVYLTILAFAAPTIWKAQLEASLTSCILTFLAVHFFDGILEHPFHRYVLHSPLIPGLSRFYRSHTKHHGLTRVVWRQTGVENYYPIIEEKQHEASFFPWYSYLVFALVLTPLFILVYLFDPTIPIFLSGALGLAWSISLYELLHAAEHYPLEKWLPKLEHPNQSIRKFWRIVYAFHLRHHVDIKCNEGISGFFGIPIADFLLGTWVNPSTLYTHGTHVDKKEFVPPEPIFFIRWVDEFAEKRKQKQRNKK